MRASATREAKGAIGRILAPSRAGEWWEYKLLPILAVFYATALHGGVPLWTLWPAALALIGSLVPGAIYVSVLNDLTDREEDAAAGKHNRMAGRPGWQAALMIIIPVLAGACFAFFWRHDLPLLLAYLAAWIAFTLYSLPPFRLKVRGFAGVIADASGAHLFPSLVATLLVLHQGEREPDWNWIAAIAAWAAAYGLRGNLWHQLSDRDHDQAANVRTFVARHRPQQVVGLTRSLIFPVEFAGLLIILLILWSPLPAAALLIYLFLVERRVARWDMHVVLVQPRPRYFIFLADYYDVFLPLALLAASALDHPIDWAVIAIHILLFPNRLRMVGEESWRLRHTLRPLAQNRP